MLLIAYMNVACLNVMLQYNYDVIYLPEIDNIESFAYIWLDKENQYEYLKHPKIKRLDVGLEFALISFMKPNVCNSY